MDNQTADVDLDRLEALAHDSGLITLGSTTLRVLIDLARRAEPSVAADERAIVDDLLAALRKISDMPADGEPWVIAGEAIDRANQARAALASPAVSQQSALTKEQIEDIITAIKTVMNPAAGFFFPRGWNVLLDKLNAMLSAPATQQAVSQMDGAAVDPRVTAFYKLRDIAERDEDIESANIIQSAIAELGAVRESAATTASARDWTEDYADGENQYQCKCSTCGHSFFGHKRRVTCKVCAAVTTACASRHADWCIGGEKGPCNCRAQAPSREQDV